MAYTASVLPLQWPGLPYGAFKLQEDAILRRGKKRSLEDEDDLGRDSPSSFFSDEEQRVPEEKCIVSLQEQIVPNSELTFSNLMKRMAAKYQKRSSPTYVHAGSVQQADVLSQPFYSSQLLAAMAQVHQPMKRCRLEEPRPLDLSPRGEDRPQSPGQEIVDVVSICPEAQQQAYNMLPLTSWSISQVSQFIGSLDNCSEYAKVFEEHRIDGSSLCVLTEGHMTSILGLKLGPAAKVVAEVVKRKRMLMSECVHH